MDYSCHKNDLTGLSQNAFSRKTCPGEFDDFSDILGSKWCNQENVKRAEPNANEQCADCDENPVVEGNTGYRNIFLSWRKEKI